MSSLAGKSQCRYSYLDKCWRIRRDIKVALDAAHYLKEEKTCLSIISLHFAWYLHLTPKSEK